MDNPQPEHPKQERLEAFAAGRLDAVEAAALENHIAACTACCAVLDGVPLDPLVKLLQAPLPAAPQPVVPPKPGGEPTAPSGSSPPAPARADDATLPFPMPSGLAGHERYRILAQLGAGGMGEVYRAEHKVMKRVVALKVITAALLDHPEAAERFSREVEAAARLSHPNIVTAYDAERCGGRHFLVMEFVEGITLARLVQERGPLPVGVACDYVRQVALGLQHAFEQGMTHRDVKPLNLMVSKAQGAQSAGMVKILDFGLARLSSEARPLGSLTGSGVLVGTPEYMAPEQARAAHRADTRADVYSLGCTLYFLLTGRPPFPEGSYLQKVAAHARKVPPPVATFRGDVPRGLVAILNRMLAKSPDDRYQTPLEVAAALAPFADSADTAVSVRPAGGAAVPGPIVRQGWRRLVRPRWLAAAAALLLTGAAIEFGPAFFHTAARQDGQFPPAGDEPAPDPVGVIRRFEGHKRKVSRGVVFTADGRRALSGSEDRTLRLWDVATGKEIRRFDGHAGAVECVALSRDGRRALSGGADDDPTVRLWDVESGKELLRVAHGRGVCGVAFSPDGRQAVAGGFDNTVRVWNLETGKEIRRFDGETWVLTVAFSPDGRQVLCGNWHGGLLLWDLAGKGKTRRFSGHTALVERVAFSADGKRILSASADKTVRLWDGESGREVRRFLGHKEPALCVAFSPDGRRALSGGRDTTVRLWDVETGKQLHHFDGHSSDVWSVTFSPDGKRALSGSADRTLRLWGLPPFSPTGGRKPPVGELRVFTGHRDYLRRVAWSPDGMRLLSCGHDGTVRLWEVNTGKELRRFEEHTGPVRTVAWSPDGRRALTGGVDKTLRLWDVDSGKEVRRFAVPAAWVCAAALSPDGAYALSGHEDHGVWLWEVASGRKLRQFVGHEGAVADVAFSPDGRRALTCGHDRTARLWDVGSGKELRRFQVEEGAIENVAFSPGGRHALCNGLRTLYWWDVETGQEVRRFQGHTDWLIGAALSPDGGRILSCGRDRTVRLWDVESGREVHRFEGHVGAVTSVAFSPDGRLAVSAGADGTIRLWGLPRASVPIGEIRRFEGHTETIWSVVFSPDGRFAFSAGGDRTIREWDVNSGRETRRLKGLNLVPFSLALAPDGKTLAAGGDGRLRLWDLTAKQPREQASLEPDVGGAIPVAFSPDGKRVACGASNGSVQLWEVGAGQPRKSALLEGHSGRVMALAFSSDGKLLAAGGYGGGARLWDVSGGKPTERFVLTGPAGIVESLAFSADNKSLAMGPSRDGVWTRPGEVWLWDVRTGKRQAAFLAHDGMVRALAYSPTGKALLTAGFDRKVKLWSLLGEKAALEVEFPGHSGPIWCLTVSPDGRYALSGSSDRTVRLWKLPAAD